MPAPPPIVLILCHDLGQRLGCYGVPGLRTPALDALAAESAQCDRYFAPAPLCSPSRGSLMTGRYPHSHGLMGLVNRGWSLPDDVPTLPQQLVGAGYHPVLFGLHHEKPQALAMGYREHRHPQGPHTCDTVSAEFADWLRARDRSDPPFFACLGFLETHRPFAHPRYTPDDPAEVFVPPWLPDAPETREELAALHGMIHAVDAAVARIVAALQETGHADGTLLIFSADHGIAFPRAKSTLYDSGLATPLLLRWPQGFAGGRRYGELLSNIDLMPTLLEAAGAAEPPGVQGRSFLPLLRGEPYQARGQVFAEKTWHDAYDPMRAVRTEQYKYIRSFPGADGAPPTARPRLVLPLDIEDGSSRRALARLGDPHLAPRPAEELYDLAADPDELHNVADDPAHAGARTDLRARLDRWMEETDDPLRRGPIPGN